jgi:hypothetical protein
VQTRELRRVLVAAAHDAIRMVVCDVRTLFSIMFAHALRRRRQRAPPAGGNPMRRRKAGVYFKALWVSFFAVSSAALAALRWSSKVGSVDEAKAFMSASFADFASERNSFTSFL